MAMGPSDNIKTTILAIARIPEDSPIPELWSSASDDEL